MIKKVVVGLYGGVAAGKDFVTAVFEENGAASFDADKVGHVALKNPTIKEQIKKAFQEDVTNIDGEIDRAKLAPIVFGDSKKRKLLESIVHPYIRDAAKRFILETNVECLILNAPLLSGSPLEDLVDVKIFVDVPENIREERAMASRGCTAGEVSKRDKAQPPIAVKREACKYIIDNSVSRQFTREQILNIEL